MARLGSQFEYGGKIKRHDKREKTSAGFRRLITATALFILAGVSAMLLIFSLLERVELIRQNDVNLELRAELRELREENRRLAIKYEYAVNITELEKYAKNELGMLSIAQIVPEKIEVETQDKALSLNK